MASDNSFSPRVAIVTGAARGIGRVIALRLAQEGLDVGVNDISSNAEGLSALAQDIEKHGRKAIAVIADVSEEVEVVQMIDRVVQELGRLDVMVANAGIASKGTLLEMSVDQWDTVMRVNARGTMLCYKHAAKQMIKQGGGGRIIGASSVLGKQASAQLASYSSSKFAVRGLTQSLALELADHKITVNAYAPGLIYTPMTANTLDAQMGGSHGDALRATMRIPPEIQGAAPDVVASVVAYLVKPETYFIIGQCISVNGGLYMD